MGEPSSLYHLILDETLTCFEEWWLEWDREGDILIVLQECAEGLRRCLEAGVADGDTRQHWLEAKLEDIRLGGVDFATPASQVVLEQATDEEWAWIEDRLRKDLAKASDWTRSSLVGFLAARRELSGREAEAGALVLEHGTPRQRAFLLLGLGRIAEQHFTDLPGLVKQFADALVGAGRPRRCCCGLRGRPAR